MDSEGRIKNELQVSVPRLHGRSKSGLVSTMTTMLKSQFTCTMHLTSVTPVGEYLKQVLKIAHTLKEWTLQCPWAYSPHAPMRKWGLSNWSVVCVSVSYKSLTMPLHCRLHCASISSWLPQSHEHHYHLVSWRRKVVDGRGCCCWIGCFCQQVPLTGRGPASETALVLQVRLSLSSQYLQWRWSQWHRTQCCWCSVRVPRQQQRRRHLSLPHCPPPALPQLRGHDPGELMGRREGEGVGREGRRDGWMNE